MPSTSLDHLLRRLADEPGQRVGIAVHDGFGLGLSIDGVTCAISDPDPLGLMARLDAEHSPRWVWWDSDTARVVAEHLVPIDRCWDVVAVHRLIHGGWNWPVAAVWASLHGLDIDELPELGQLDLLDSRPGQLGAPDDPVQPDGHLRPEWVAGGYTSTPDRLAAWAQLALDAATIQNSLIASLPEPGRVTSTAHAESATSLLCAELERGGLPFDETKALEILGASIGPRPVSRRDEDAQQELRDNAVLQHVESHQRINLRNSDDVRSLLRRLDIDLPDTRAWRLEQHRDAHPIVPALLQWRKSERIATTYGYRWLDEHVTDGRLRGSWGCSDGSAGRMTASAGLHNLPAEMRPAIAADPGHVLVRADLGQVEPRVLAAVSGDSEFIAATQSDDLYAEVAQQLGVSRESAKLAVLGAMYGATTGESAHALRRLQQAYPTAMAFLDDAARHGQNKIDLRTSGGRRIRLSSDSSDSHGFDAARAAAASRGRYARNAVIQGAAAEFFKVWAIVVRRKVRSLDARVALCLHDELLVHCSDTNGTAVVDAMMASIHEASYYWSPSPAVRFVADVAVVHRWSEVGEGKS